MKKKTNRVKKWKVLFFDDLSNRIKTINPIPKNFILPRIGDYVEVDGEESQTRVVTSVYHCYHDKEMCIFTDWYGNYNELLTTKQE